MLVTVQELSRVQDDEAWHIFFTSSINLRPRDGFFDERNGRARVDAAAFGEDAIGPDSEIFGGAVYNNDDATL